MKIVFQKKSILYFFLVLFLLTSNVLMINQKTYAFVCTFCNKKYSNNQQALNHKIQQLNQTTNAHSQCLIQLQQQLSENQQDFDMLRGNIQDIQHRMSQIMHDQKEIYNKLNYMLNNNNLNVLNNKTQFPKSNDTSEIDTSSKLDYKEKHNNGDIDYKMAVSLVLEKKQYVQAIQKFQDFVKNYPKSHYQPNAHYWLGQLYYNQGKKNDASYHFAWVVKNYPKSSKAPDALLKIGIIMQETNQLDKAQTIYRQLGKLYPDSDSAKQAQKRLSRFRNVP